MQYYRAKSDFHIENGHLCFRGKRKELSKVVNTTFTNVQGCGARALSYKLKRKYTGVSENIVKGVLDKSKMYGRQYLKFSNKAPLKSIIANDVGIRWQIDLISMRGDQVVYDGQKYEYILSIIDFFSR